MVLSVTVASLSVHEYNPQEKCEVFNLGTSLADRFCKETEEPHTKSNKKAL